MVNVKKEEMNEKYNKVQKENVKGTKKSEIDRINDQIIAKTKKKKKKKKNRKKEEKKKRRKAVGK